VSGISKEKNGASRIKCSRFIMRLPITKISSLITTLFLIIRDPWTEAAEDQERRNTRPKYAFVRLRREANR
jgi:hypothetical protein